jgi:flavodoxin I
MKNIAIFYSSSSGDTKRVADLISKELDDIKEFDIKITGNDFINDYTNIILGVSTYTDGQLQLEWQKIWDGFCKIDFTGKKVAIFGLGDQIKYPDNFVDAMGTLYTQIKKSNGEIIGFTSIKGYQFNSSKAIVDNEFVGLAIDLNNTQEHQIIEKIKNWTEELKKDFN